MNDAYVNHLIYPGSSSYEDEVWLNPVFSVAGSGQRRVRPLPGFGSSFDADGDRK